MTNNKNDSRNDNSSKDQTSKGNKPTMSTGRDLNPTANTRKNDGKDEKNSGINGGAKGKTNK